MQINVQLKILLKQKDITVTQLARATGVSAKTIYNWMKNQPPRNINQLKMVADYFEVSLDFLCFGVVPGNQIGFETFKDEINAGEFEVILKPIKR